MRDLGRAFTRAIPPANDADTVWASLPTGDAGSLEVSIEIDAEGKIKGFTPLGKVQPAHLLGIARRTLALLRGGTFAIQSGSVSAGQQVLRLSAQISDVAPPEQGTGGATGLGFRWDGKHGLASFTQASGRHVEVKVELVRVLVGQNGEPI